MIMDQAERYLGDGLYASYDGFQICLRTPRLDGDHEVYLEPSVYLALVEFVADLKREAAITAGKGTET